MHGNDQIKGSWIKENYGLIDVVSVGIIVWENKKQITIAQDLFPQKQFNKGMQYEENQYRSTSSYPK